MTAENREQQEIDAANARFWDELCGTWFADQVGISDRSLDSLRRFDDAYLRFYPYLLHHVPVDRMGGKRVLEIGLGYGTLGQKIAEAGADYLGLDIAAGPVEMMNTRLRMTGLNGEAIQGSILDSGLPSASFDAVVSIGCFHHTGDVQRSIDEAHRLLKPGGEAFIMVYNKFSLRRWLSWPITTARAAINQARGLSQSRSSGEFERRAYDASLDGAAAPETVFLSRAEVRVAFGEYARVQVVPENADPIAVSRIVIVPRSLMLRVIGRTLGLDLYIAAKK